MATVLRSFSLSCSGNIQARVRFYRKVLTAGASTLNVRSYTYASGTIQTPIGDFSFSGVPDDIDPDNSADVPVSSVWSVSVSPAAGGLDSDSASISHGNTTGGGFRTWDFDDNMTGGSQGSFELTCDAELVFEDITESIPSGTGTDATGFIPDPPHSPITRRVYWIRAQEGGSSTGTISLGGASASVTTTNATAFIITAVNLTTGIISPDQCQFEIEAHARCQSGDDATPVTVSGLCAIDPDYRGASSSESASASSTYGTATITGATLTCTPTTNGRGSDEDCYATAELHISPQKDYSIDAALRAMNGAYPVDVDLDWYKCLSTVDNAVATGGSWTGSYVQRQQLGSVGVDGDSDTITDLTDFDRIALAVDSTWKSGRKEPTTDVWLLFKDRLMPGLTLAQSAAFTLASGTDSAITGGKRRSWSPAVGLMGHRYLRIKVTDSESGAAGGLPLTVTIGSKEWTRDRSGAALVTDVEAVEKTFVIDLCAPTNQTADTDGTDTTYPYSGDWTASGGDEDDYHRTGSGAYTGPMSAAALDVVATGTATLSLGAFALLRETGDAQPTIINLPTHRGWFEERPATVVSESDTTTVHYGRQCFSAMCQGRSLGLEWSDTLWDRTEGGVSGAVTHNVQERTIAALADRINSGFLAPGWTATVDAVAYDADETTLANYYNRNRPMHGLLGGGYYWDGSAWQSGLDKAASSGSVALSWQGGFTSVDFPGGVGDIFEHDAGLLDGQTFLKATKVLGNQAEALVIDEDGAGVASEVVTLTQAATARGTGTTDSGGVAITGTPWGRGDDGTVTVDAVGFDLTYSPLARKRFHGRWKKTEIATGGISVDTSAAGWTVYADEDAEAISIHRSTNWETSTWEDISTGLTGIRPWVRWWPEQQLSLLYVESETVYRAYSASEGKAGTWSSPVTVGSGTISASDVHPAGWELAALRNTSGGIDGVWLAVDGATVRSSFTILSTGAVDGALGVTYDSSAQRWYVFYRDSGGDIQRLQSSDGVTFSA